MLLKDASEHERTSATNPYPFLKYPVCGVTSEVLATQQWVFGFRSRSRGHHRALDLERAAVSTLRDSSTSREKTGKQKEAKHKNASFS